jgi:hypothetical protein
MKAFNKKRKEKHKSKVKYFKGHSFSLHSIRRSFGQRWSEKYWKIKTCHEIKERIEEVLKCYKDLIKNK